VAKINLTVCDVDQNPTVEARTYRITVDGKSYSADLCDEHSAPIREVMRIAEAAGSTGRATARRGVGDFSAKVKTIEEIEAEKAAAGKGNGGRRAAKKS